MFGGSAAPPAGYEWSHPHLRDAVVGYYAALDSTAQASDQFGALNANLLSSAVRNISENEWAYKFNGSLSYCQPVTTFGLPTAAISVSFWFKLDGTYDLSGYIGAPVNSSLNTSFAVYYFSGALRFWIGDYLTFATIAFSDTTSWHHFCGTWDGTTIRIYVDGIEGTSGSKTGTLTHGNLRFGNVLGASAGMNGFMDDILIYDRALSGSEVTELSSARGYVYQTNMDFGWNFPDTEAAPPVAGYLASADTGADADDQFGSANGTLENGMTRVTSDGLAAYDFDGTNDYIQLGAIPEVNNASALSICGWVYRNVLNTVNTLFLNADNNAAPSANSRLWVTWYSDNIIYFTNCNGSNTYIQVTKAVTGWHHIACVFDGSKTGNLERMKIFFDGELQVSLSSSGTIPATTYNATSGNPWVGRYGGIYNQNGTEVDDLLIFDRPLTGGEIAMLASKRGIIYEANDLPTSVPTPDHWYIASEDTGADAEDLIGSSNGQLQNGATRATLDGLLEYFFDGGNDNLNFGLSSWDISGLSEYTMSMWLYPTALGTNDTFGGWSGLGNQYLAQTGTGSSTVIRAVCGSNSDYADTPAGIYNAGRLQHFAMVYKGGGDNNAQRLKIYVNGVLIQPLTYTGTIPAVLPTLPTNNTRIAAKPGVGNYFPGYIDDIRFFDAALSADEVYYISRSRMQGYP